MSRIVWLLLAASLSVLNAPANDARYAWYPDGTLKMIAHYQRDAFHGEYRTWYPSGAPFEVRHYDHGRESGLQQSWTIDGQLYLNYEVRNGRRYGFVNAKPCVPVAEKAAPTSASTLPYYVDASFTPHWTRPAASRSLDFNLVTQDGTPLTAADLRGRIHVASFIFTRCTAICPVMVKQLETVQDSVEKDVVFVSYSVTPDLDRPGDLAAFAARHGVNPARWRLVTGDRAQIYRLARDFYFAQDRRALPDGEFLHTEKVVLVDGNGDLRGVYNGTQPFDMQRLREDITVLQVNR